jgi:isocitrate lyase
MARAGIEACIARSLAYAPYSDLLWMETSEPSLDEARRFADAIHARHPGKLLAYNCSPSFNWSKKLDAGSIATFREQLNAMGYKFQFITLAGFHTLNYSFFKLAHDFKTRGMTAYAEFQQEEFAAEAQGYTATRHQREVGTGYFDEVAAIVGEGEVSTTALRGSTEAAQFYEETAEVSA